MSTPVNLLVDPKLKVGHILRADGKRVCHCRVSRDADVEENVDISVPHPERQYNVCEESWKRLRKELDKLEKWTRATLNQEGVTK